MASHQKSGTLEDAAETSMVKARHGWSAHSRAYLLAAVAYTGIFLFGYDAGLGGGVIALPTFLHDFGLANLSKKSLADISGNIVAILHGGAFFGAIFGGFIENGLGRVRALWLGCFVFTAGGVIQTACFGSLPQFYIGRLLCGVAVGLMSVVCPTYGGEIAPKEIRGKVIVTVGVAVSYWTNYGVSFMTLADGSKQWRIPIGIQLAPVAIMMCLLPFLKESPRWLATKHRDELALRNLAYIRKAPIDDDNVKLEFAEIIAAIREEEENTKGASWRDIFAKGNPMRFAIAFGIFTLQQWSGQNSIGYYAPKIFQSIGFEGANMSLLASGIYGIVKIVATAAFIYGAVEKLGRKWPHIIGAGLMGMFLIIIGAVMYTHAPPAATGGTTASGASPAPASIAMAVMIYFYVIPYCFSVGPLPWVICSEIFNNRTRHLGLMTAAGTQWLWNFAVSKATPLMIIALPKGGIFMFFAAMNFVSVVLGIFFLPETKGVSLEAMDIIFGATTAEERERDLAARAREMNIGGAAGADEKDLGEADHIETVKYKQSV